MTEAIRNAKNSRGPVYKRTEYKAFKLWLSFQQNYEDVPRRLSNFWLRDEDPLLQKIAAIKTQKEFAKIFGIKDLGTLTDWRKKAERDGLPYIYFISDLANLTIKNLLGSLYIRLLKHAYPRDIMLWMRLVEGWKPNNNKRYIKYENEITEEDLEHKKSLEKLLEINREQNE